MFLASVVNTSVRSHQDKSEEWKYQHFRASGAFYFCPPLCVSPLITPIHAINLSPSASASTPAHCRSSMVLQRLMRTTCKRISFSQESVFWLDITNPEQAVLNPGKTLFSTHFLSICASLHLHLLIHPGWSPFPALGWLTNTHISPAWLHYALPELRTGLFWGGNRTELTSGWLESSSDPYTVMRWQLMEDITG